MSLDYPLPAIIAEIAFNLVGLILFWRYGWPGRANRGPARLRTWDLPVNDFLLFLCLAASGGFTVGSGTGALLRHVPLDSDIRLLLGGAAMEAGVLIGAAVFYYGLPRLRAGQMKVGFTVPDEPEPKPSIWTTGAATFLLSLPILNATSMLWQGLLKLLGLPVEKQDMVDLLENTHLASVRILLVVLAGFGAPLMEEIVFRAGLFRYLRTRLPRWAGLLIPALVFGAAHLSLAFFLPLTVLGVIFSLAYERTGRLGTTIVAHGLFNLNTILMVLAGFGS